MAWVDGVFMPGYAVKSAIKLLLFFMLPLLCALPDRVAFIKSLFVPNKKRLVRAAAFGAVVYAVILGVYFLLRDHVDFSGITGTLEKDAGVNRGNFLFVAVYISVVNSLLEEFFFRGVAFLAMKQAGSRKAAYMFSASAFAAYHVALLSGWFTPAFFGFLIACLFFVGILFDRLDEKSGTLYPSFMVHISANLAINTIGLILFGII